MFGGCWNYLALCKAVVDTEEGEERGGGKAEGVEQGEGRGRGQGDIGCWIPRGCWKVTCTCSSFPPVFLLLLVFVCLLLCLVLSHKCDRTTIMTCVGLKQVYKICLVANNSIMRRLWQAVHLMT